MMVPVGNCEDSFSGAPGLFIFPEGYNWLEGQRAQRGCELAQGHHQRIHYLQT